MRKKMIAGNWKMYKTPEQTAAFFRDFLPMVASHTRHEIAWFVRHLSICKRLLNQRRAPTSPLVPKTFIGKKKAPLPAKSRRSCSTRSRSRT